MALKYGELQGSRKLVTPSPWYCLQLCVGHKWKMVFVGFINYWWREVALQHPWQWTWERRNFNEVELGFSKLLDFFFFKFILECVKLLIILCKMSEWDVRVIVTEMLEQFKCLSTALLHSLEPVLCSAALHSGLQNPCYTSMECSNKP